MELPFVDLIAHFCDLLEPRQLCRFHCRLAMDNGRSLPVEEFFPDRESFEPAVTIPRQPKSHTPEEPA